MWVATLRAVALHQVGSERALGDVHALLVRMARSQAHRAGPRWGVGGPELDDIAHQAAADVLLTLAEKVDEFRGDSRFTTWAFPFVRLTVLNKLSRNLWSRPAAWPTDADLMERVAAPHDPCQRDPASELEALDLLAAVRRAVEVALTARQRRVLVAMVFEGVTAAEVAGRLHMSRNAVYKCVFDARARLRKELVTAGFLSDDGADGQPRSSTAVHGLRAAAAVNAVASRARTP